MATIVSSATALVELDFPRYSRKVQIEQQLKFFDKHAPVVADRPFLDVLEIGCGNPANLALALHARGHHVTAIDPSLSEGTIEKAQEKGANLRLIKGDFLEWDHEQHLNKHQHQYFDVVLFTKSLHHIPEIDNALVKAWSLVKPQTGVLLIEEFAREVMNEVTATWFYGTFDAFRSAGFTKKKVYSWMRDDEHSHSHLAHQSHSKEEGHQHHPHSHAKEEPHHHHHHQHQHLLRHDDEAAEALAPIERWKAHFVHTPPLHTGSRIREALKRLLMDLGGGKEEEERGAYLYLYFVDILEDLRGVDKEPNGYNVVQKLIKLEQSLIDQHAIVPIGINFSVAKHGH